jgi:hypothetical protein
VRLRISASRGQTPPKHDENLYRASFSKQFCLLLQRAFRNLYRNPMTSYSRIFSILLIILMMMLVFGQLDNDYTSIQFRNGVLYFITMTVAIHQLLSVVHVFPDEKPEFLRKHGSRMYSTFSYFSAIITAAIPNLFLLRNWAEHIKS